MESSNPGKGRHGLHQGSNGGSGCWCWRVRHTCWKESTESYELFSDLHTCSVVHTPACIYMRSINVERKYRRKSFVCGQYSAMLRSPGLLHDLVSVWLSAGGGLGWEMASNYECDKWPWSWQREIESKTPEHTQNEQSKTHLPLFCVLYHWAIWLKQISRTRVKLLFCGETKSMRRIKVEQTSYGYSGERIHFLE